MSAAAVFSTPVSLAAFVALFAVAGALVLGLDSSRFPAWRAFALRWTRRLTGTPDLAWVDLPLVTLLAASAYAVAVIVFWSLGGYGCTPAGPSDLITLTTSGKAFVHGGNPFTITACGVGGNPVPAGMASVLLDALGATAGPAGVLVVWGAVSVALVPLVWSVAPERPKQAAVFVLASFLYLPIVAAQVDGASLALVPLTVLLTLHLSRRGWGRAAAVGGFLATGRFPSLFPVLGATGRAGSRRIVVALAAVATFAAVTGATFAVFGSRFTGPVFWLQFGRSNLALDYWGVLEGTGWLRPSTSLTVAQAVLTLALVAICWARARSELGATAIVLTGAVLLTQYLSFTALVFLVPIALVSSRARGWLWAIGVVASTNYLLAQRALRAWGGPYSISYALDGLLTALLLAMLFELVRKELDLSGLWPRGRRDTSTPGGPERPSAEG